jgi:hypothetical protein
MRTDEEGMNEADIEPSFVGVDLVAAPPASLLTGMWMPAMTAPP